ncbi:AAA family ATPase [Massilia sp. W12]|uniref:leucine-rich repeat domain-containing protein n=1 Tax=Massilia sp. W12 TaxID=3126507 RepID=UPI0030D6128B
MSKPKKLPLGVQTFKKIIEGGYYYVDKTDLACQLIEDGGYYFLSRPRRFGKSLFLDTLKSIFAGEKDLFAGLAAEHRVNWAPPRPIIHLNFAMAPENSLSAWQNVCMQQLQDVERQYGFQGSQAHPAQRLAELIAGLHRTSGQKVVVLVDEYDKPILDSLEDPDLARKMQNFLAGLYSPLKSEDAHLHFVFLTGVSKFSKVNLFSGLNHLTDISLKPRYATVCGYTETDLHTVFADRLGDLPMAKIKQWYNGYNWLGTPVYNPWSLLNLFDNQQFKAYWIETGMSTFLVQLLKKKNFFLPGLSGWYTDMDLSGKFNIDNISPIALLFQTGYLTIKEVEERDFEYRYTIDFPNLEVKKHFSADLFVSLTGQNEQGTQALTRLGAALAAGRWKEVCNSIHAQFAAIPYNYHANNNMAHYEGWYASVFFSMLSALDFTLIAEDVTNHGRIDLTLFLPDTICLFEFKVQRKGKADSALAQIITQKYAEKYSNDQRSLVAIGITFSEESRNIIGFDVKIGAETAQDLMMQDEAANDEEESAAKTAYALALQRIEQCRIKQGTALNLGGMGLAQLPPEIGQLTALTDLYLNENQLTALPPEIGQLTALRLLYLHENQLTALPPEIGQLRALTVLHLSGNQLTALPPEIGQLTALTRLDLDQNQLTALPPEIGQLRALTELGLHENQLTALPPEIGQLRALTELALWSNQLTALPPEIGQLTALTALYLNENQLTALPPEIGELTALKELYLYENQLTALPPEIGELTALKELYLHENQLTALPPEIGQLTALKELYLYENQLTALPPEIGQLTALKELYLYENQLTALPPEIGQLTALKGLYLQENQLTALPPEIGQLTALKELNLHKNQLTALPPEIGQLTALTELALWSNQLTALPPEIGQLTALTELRLDQNQLTALPPEIGQLTALTTLTLGRNQLTALPPEIGQLLQLTHLIITDNRLTALPAGMHALTQLKQLWLHDNPALGIPAAILGGNNWSKRDEWADPKTILAYYFSRSKASARPLNEVKLLIVGRGGAGKTSTVRALQGKPFNKTEESTTGVALCDLALPDCQSGAVTAHVWDFAGQVITHSLHQFFLSERSIYVLVLTGRENSEEDDAEYWLRLIMAFGKDEQGNPPPVIVTLNKWDDQGCRPKLDREVLQERYPCIVSFIETDCQSNLGIAELKQRLTQTTDSLAWVSQAFPDAWAAVRDTIVKTREHSPHLPFAAFRSLCESNQITQLQDQIALADILHVLGIALNYRRDPRLREATVLQANWLTQNVYAMLRFAETNTGILTRQERDSVLAAETEPAMRDYLMQIMERFEVAYAAEHAGQTVWLLPQALPDSQPKAAAPLANSEDATRLRYSYEALPEGLLARAIVRMHEFIEIADGQRLQWAKGVILNMDGARALLRANPRERQISLTVTGEEPARRKLAGLCRSHMRAIHDDIRGLAPIEETQVEGQWLDIAILEADEKQGRQTAIALRGIGSRTIDPVPLNNAYNTPAARSDAWKPKVFISYSKANARQRDSLVNQLNILANEGLMAAHWHDRMIIPGEDWHARIQAELQEADLIVLLLSNAALATEYIVKHEIPLALSRHDAKLAHFVPVIVEDCRWTEHKSGAGSQLKDLNALPEKGKAINTWRPNQNAGWKSVGDGLARVLKEILAQAEKSGKSHQRREAGFRND